MTITTSEYPTIASVAEDGLRFYRRHLVANGYTASAAVAATSKGSNRWATCNMVAGALGILFANNRVGEDATMPDTATGDDLVRLCDTFGIEKSSGAGASGNVVVSCTGTVTYATGQELTSDKTGKRYRVISATVASNGSEVAITGIDLGVSTNLDAGEVMTWTSPPAGSAVTCVVGSGGLQFGKNADTDSSLRRKLLDRLRNPQNGGSWAHVKRWVEDSTASVETAYVYPCAQGPATVHCAYTVEGNRDNDYSREGSTALTNVVVTKLLLEAPEFSDAVVTVAAEEDLSVSIKATLPLPKSSGGQGGGWINDSADRWPLCLSSGATVITTVVNASTFTVNSTTTLPTAGKTIVHIFDSAARRVRTARVVSYTSTGGGPYNVTVKLDAAFDSVVANDYISPGLERGDSYANTFQSFVAALAPGEKTSNSAVLPRAYRHPRTIDGFPSGITVDLVSALHDRHTEIVSPTFFALNGSTAYTLPLEPTVPASVTSPPNVWRVLRFAIYPA